MREDQYSVVRYYNDCELVVGEIFHNVGFTLENSNSLICDFYAKKDGNQFAVEVKCSREGKIASNTVLAAANKLMKAIRYPLSGYTPILVIVGTMRESLRKNLNKDFPELIIIDIGNLLYMVKANEVLRKKFISILSFSVDTVELVEPSLNLTFVEVLAPIDIWDRYIKRLREWNPEQEKSNAYEELCSELLQQLFIDDLHKWQKQKSTNDGLFRLDAIAKIKHGNKKEFWEMIERYFSSKYIVFEYKNYSQKITQAQVYTTVKYLYAKALRRVAILISTNGADEHAHIAIRGILREEGKLIIALSNKDLISMLEMKQRDEDPAEYLGDKLDNLLVELEK